MSELTSRSPGVEAAPGEGLEKGHLSLTQLVSLSLASFVPAIGIALVPTLLFTSAGVNAWPSALLSMIAVICIGLAVIAFARRFVSTGSLYSYVGEVFGPWARLAAAAALLVGFVFQIAANAGIIGIFTGSFMASLGMDNALEFGPQVVIFIAALGISAAIAIRGLDTSIMVAVTLAVISVPLVLAITVGSAVHTGLDLSVQFDMAQFGLSGTLQGVAGGAAFLVAFESCTSLAAESRNPTRNVPYAVMAVPVVLGLVYILCTIAQIPGLVLASADLEAGMSPPAALALQAGFGSGVASATDLVLAIASFASMIGFINYGARFAMTLGIDRVLPESIGRIHRRFKSPHIAIVALTVLGFAAIAVLVLATGTVTTGYNSLATLVVYSWVLPYLLIAAGAIALTIRDRRFKPVLIVASIVGGALMAWVYLNGWINPPPAPLTAMSWVSLVVIAVVMVGLFVRRRLSRIDVSDNP